MGEINLPMPFRRWELSSVVLLPEVVDGVPATDGTLLLPELTTVLITDRAGWTTTLDNNRCTKSSCDSGREGYAYIAMSS